MKELPNRRSFLKGALGATGAMMLAKPISQAVAADICGLTPEQAAGPFYPGEGQFSPDNDLTTIKGQTGRAKGQVIYIKGQVQDLYCQPLKDATVEIWQACDSGKYNNRRDPNPAELDPNFQYWGETLTNDKGEYMFKTILPGAYPADVDWTRPPHIHFKIEKLGYKELVTQMYFKGNRYNDADLILKAIPESERDSVIVDFVPSPDDLEPGSLIGEFNIKIAKIR